MALYIEAFCYTSN